MHWIVRSKAEGFIGILSASNIDEIVNNLKITEVENFTFTGPFETRKRAAAISLIIMDGKFKKLSNDLNFENEYGV